MGGRRLQPKAPAAALGRGLLHPAKANLNGHVVHVPLCGELLHRDRLPVEAKLPVAALPHALGQDLLGLVEIRADGFPTASARRVVIADRVLLSPFPDGPQLSASFLAEAMPVPSDRSGLHGESRYLTRCSKSTLLGTDGRPCCSPERSRSVPIASELVDPGGELVSVEPKILPELHVGNA